MDFLYSWSKYYETPAMSYELWKENLYVPVMIHGNKHKVSYMALCKSNYKTCVEFHTDKMYYDYLNDTQIAMRQQKIMYISLLLTVLMLFIACLYSYSRFRIAVSMIIVMWTLSIYI